MRTSSYTKKKFAKPPGGRMVQHSLFPVTRRASQTAEPLPHRTDTRTVRRVRRRKPVTKTISFDLDCRFCANPAEGIAFQSRYVEGRPTVETPVLACRSCHHKQDAAPAVDGGSPYWNIAPDGRVSYLSFEKIQSKSKSDLPRLWSLSRFEVNQFRTPRWMKTLWRIWFIGRRPVESQNSPD